MTTPTLPVPTGVPRIPDHAPAHGARRRFALGPAEDFGDVLGRAADGPSTDRHAPGPPEPEAGVDEQATATAPPTDPPGTEPAPPSDATPADPEADADAAVPVVVPEPGALVPAAAVMPPAAPAASAGAPVATGAPGTVERPAAEGAKRAPLPPPLPASARDAEPAPVPQAPGADEAAGAGVATLGAAAEAETAEPLPPGTARAAGAAGVAPATPPEARGLADPAGEPAGSREPPSAPRPAAAGDAAAAPRSDPPPLPEVAVTRQAAAATGDVPGRAVRAHGDPVGPPAAVPAAPRVGGPAVIADAPPPAAGPAPGADPPPGLQLVRALAPLRQRGDGTYELELELRPAGLGRVAVQVELRDGVVHARLRPDQHATAALLHDGLDDLRSGLQREGLRAGQLTVDIGGAPGRGHEQRAALPPDPAVPGRTATQAPADPSPGPGAAPTASPTHRVDVRM